ncbi:MAG TPA: MFS transporter [Candidatus Saccharimonadales bacterium]|nr:MFS transporter [Candidatus Saccharimonadales bacterium]
MYVPILTPFLTTQGMGATATLVVIGVGTAVSAIFEIPTGRWADSYGRRKSLIAGTLLSALAMITYATGDSLTQFCVAAAILGFGTSLMVGADAALLFETFARLRISHLAKKADARARGIAGVFEASCSLVGAWLVVELGVEISTLLWVQAGLYAVAAAIAFVLYDPLSHDEIPSVGLVRKAVTNNKNLLWALLFAATAGNLSFVLVWWTPVYYSEFSGLKIGEGAGGWIYSVYWALLLGSVFVWQTFIKRLSKMQWTSFSFMITATALCYGLLVVKPGLVAVGAIAITYFVRANIIPMSNQMLNEQIGDDRMRATIHSISRTILWGSSALIWWISSKVGEISGSLLYGIAFAGVLVVSSAALAMFQARTAIRA